MSTIKSSAEHLTLNADGASKDIKFQADGVEKASISSAGLFTATTIDATKLTGNLPAISGASLTNIDGVPSGVSLGTANSDTYVGTGDTTLQFVDGSNAVIPTGTVGAQRSDLVSLGDANNRFKDIYIAGGLRVGGTGTANALDDYEEGDWTPAVTSTGGSLATTVGRYTKTGRVVHLFCLVVSSVSYTYANSTDLWTITGVPFAEAGQGYTGQPGSFYGKLNWNNSGSASTTNSIVTPTVSSTSIQFNVCNSADVDAGNARIKCANNASFVAQVNVTYYTNA